MLTQVGHWEVIALLVNWEQVIEHSAPGSRAGAKLPKIHTLQLCFGGSLVFPGNCIWLHGGAVVLGSGAGWEAGCWKLGRRAWKVAHGMGMEGRVQRNLGIKEPGGWGLYPKWRTGDQALQPCRLLGSSTAVGDGSRKGFGRESCAGPGRNMPPGGSEPQGSSPSLWKEVNL